MTPQDTKQIELLRAYSDNKQDVLEQLLYITCIQCDELEKVTSIYSHNKRKYCDSCRKDRRKLHNSKKTYNEDIGWKKHARIKR